MSAITIQNQNQEQEQAQVSVIEQAPVQDTEQDTPQSTRGGSRSFKVKLSVDGPLYGRYNGESPYQAANKALSEIVRTKEKNGNMDDAEISFFLVESTKNSSKKQHQYVGRRIKLDVPIEYPVANGITIKKEHKNFLRKVKRIFTHDTPATETATATATATVSEPTTATTTTTATALATTAAEPTVVQLESTTTTTSTVSVTV